MLIGGIVLAMMPHRAWQAEVNRSLIQTKA